MSTVKVPVLITITLGILTDDFTKAACEQKLFKYFYSYIGFAVNNFICSLRQSVHNRLLFVFDVPLVFLNLWGKIKLSVTIILDWILNNNRNVRRHAYDNSIGEFGSLGEEVEVSESKV
jgi:hypothetical protein